MTLEAESPDAATGPCCLSRVWAGCLAWLSVLSLGVSLEGIAAFRVALGALWGVTGVEGSLGPHPSSLPLPSLLFGANPGLPVCQPEAPSLRVPLANFILRQLLLYIPGWLQSFNPPASGA